MNVAENDAQGRQRVDAFIRSLQELSWTEGRNLKIDFRWAADATNMRLNVARMVATNRT